MKTTRQLRSRKSASGENKAIEPKRSKRLVLGDVSNRRSKRLAKDAKKKSGSDIEKVTTKPDPPVERTTARRGVAQLLGKKAEGPAERNKSGKGAANADRSQFKIKRPQDGDTKRKSKGSKRRAQASKEQSKPKRTKLLRNDTNSSQPKKSNWGEKKKGKEDLPELCGDFLESTDHNLVLQRPFDAARFTHGVSAFDLQYRADPQRVSEYATDLFQRLFHAEPTYTPKGYMTEQHEINQTMREILIDWLVEVHTKFRLFPQTLYLAVNILDRYCSKVQVERNKLQLVGVTALLLACKYEEIYPPEIRDCVYMTDRSYTRQSVLDMEQSIVASLQFRLTVPTGYAFLQRFLLILGATDLMKHAASYYMERSLQEYSLVERRPSLVAAASVCLAINNPDIREQDGVAGKNPRVPKILLDYTGFKKQDILSVAQDVADAVAYETRTSSRSLTAVKKKFESRKYDSVATIADLPDAKDLVN
uniref:G2/mitotic-specific cyclin-B3 n=1 Tax=Grammatophora oceanica TaxID=210454 RepID=A0A7S1VC62_9STRA|mmetsp:Transcript_42626/g.63243  ORF Transcript_42626/g.63243 Transcript_42626/m.63243 type:complete len:477 (+) Transcript_42626:145-1575(+)|eukprot:CAMPEP_0194043508 /NCGR_PEP_ID=MMETSP0009_2-20130614/15106_1 /TAXON_ID=210454 /ORGANISM="Grammatophora oceanica, Strain CCMP 410" /LENGTH=476 /DNA_ID=CAMNT_0038687725 /DNA_START=112 /DNA_END=1542 /DNA_ORIENTATION=-